MAVTPYKPTTPARRGMSSQDLSKITAKKPVKSLLRVKNRINGRNNRGVITVRHRGGGAKKFYRLVNFKQLDIKSAVVEAIEYDPNRSARLARLKDENGNYHYVLAHTTTKVGKKLTFGEKAAIEDGNRLPLANIPIGSFIFNIELQPGQGGKMVRSAGAKAQLTAREGEWANIKLPSGEIRRIHASCQATVGTVGNEQHQNVKIGSAGRKRHLGFRPTVRGVVMNAVDHPHGGGDGGRHGTGKGPRTPWGQPTLGYKTRRNKRSTKFIVKSRHAGKRK